MEPDPSVPPIELFSSEDEIHRVLVRLVKSLKVHGASYAYARGHLNAPVAMAELTRVDGLLDEVLVVLGTPAGADMVWLLRPGAYLG
jgi:hypothetical protein